jgi:hypothetical protein
MFPVKSDKTNAVSLPSKEISHKYVVKNIPYKITQFDKLAGYTHAFYTDTHCFVFRTHHRFHSGPCQKWSHTDCRSLTKKPLSWLYYTDTHCFILRLQRPSKIVHRDTCLVKNSCTQTVAGQPRKQSHA